MICIRREKKGKTQEIILRMKMKGKENRERPLFHGRPWKPIQKG
jgi:hypothetical protein